MRARLLPLFPLVITMLSGCGETAKPASELDELSRINCQEPVTIGDGVWHLDVSVSGGAAALRVSDQPALDGHAIELRRDAANGDWFSVEYPVSGGFRERWLYNACVVPATGRIGGPVQRCLVYPSGGKMCNRGSFVGVRVERRAGEGESQGLVKVGEFGDFPGSRPRAQTVNVRVKDGYAYLARYGDGLAIVDVRDPSKPVPVARVSPRDTTSGEIWNDVKLYSHYALVASNREGMVVLDVADPTAPRYVTGFPGAAAAPPGNAHTLAVEGNRAYLADTALRGLHVVDLTDPEHPKTAGTWVEPSAADNISGVYLHDLEVEGGVAYLHYWRGGFIVLDTNGDKFALLGQASWPRATSHAGANVTVGGRRYAVHGEEDFGAHLRVFDITARNDSKWMTQVGELSLRPEVSTHNMIAVGSRVYVAWYQDGVRAVDIGGDGKPAISAYYNSWDPRVHPGEAFYEGAYGVDVDPAKKLVYVADDFRGLIILNDPSMPAP